MKFLLLFIVSISVFFSCTESPNTTLLLSGDDWEFSRALDPEESTMRKWKPATVPGSVQADLLRLGEIPDPFKLNNEDSIQWISEKNWSYKKTFNISSEILNKKKHILKFEGLDTNAMIWFNNGPIYGTKNSFRSYEIDVSEILKEKNTLTIDFFSLDSLEKNEEKKLNYTLPESPRVFTRKPQFQYGWDWGPTIKTMGIWRDVSLISYDEARMTDAFIQTDNISKEKATLTAHIEIAGITPHHITAEVINNTTGEHFKSGPAYDKNSRILIPLTIKNPQLWWTHNLGEPFLYDFTINLKKGSSTIQSINKKVGIRTIELVTEKDLDGESFLFKLNGESVYMKGANYIPQNIFLAEVTPEQRIKLLDDAVEANMNMLRVWGGGVYEDDLFYDLCDEKGILIWQDFMFACAMYPGDKAFLANVKAEAIDNVKRLRQHPSIALYCGNNENSEGWARWGWQADKTEAQKEEIWNSYQAVFNDMLPKVVDSLTPSISYWESSPKYGRGDKRYQFEGDAHDWWVWHDGYPFEHYDEEVPRFMSEFGFQSFPSYEAIKYFTEQDSIDLNHPSFAKHQKHSRGFQLIKEYMARDFPVPTNDKDYVYVSQLLQAYGIGKGIRAHRLAKPYNMGTLYWQLNDCWPVVSWSSIDGLGNWKALHYEVKRAFQDVLITTKIEEDIFTISIINDNFFPITENLTLELISFDGKSQSYGGGKPTIMKNDNKWVFKRDLSAFNFFDNKKTVLKITFGNTHYLHYFVKPKDLKLSTQSITSEIVKVENGYDIKLRSKTLQKNVFLYSAEKGHFSDNFFDLLPNEEKTIHFKTEATELKDIQIKTLNGIQETINNDL